MKNLTSILGLLLLAFICLLSTSCVTKGGGPLDTAQLSKLGNVAITAAEIGGAIKPAEAKAIRAAGKLVLDAQSGKELHLETISVEAVEYAVASGSISKEQAAALESAGVVPLNPSPPAVATSL